jgi:zinc and cadmium transporter
MMNLYWALCASITVSLISLIGIISLIIRQDILNRALIILIGFSAGGLIGGAFLHLLPEALELGNSADVFLFAIAGFILFFVLERYFHWRHCHDGVCDIHAFTYLNLIGDGIHNFIDGLVIGASFVLSIKIGIIATLAIVLHEIPQEVGDFGVLVYGGMTRMKALFFNFLSALAAVVGTMIGYYFSLKTESLSAFLLPFAAGGFIYIAASDLIPELHKQKDLKISNLSLLFFILGVAFMFLIKFVR